MTVNRRLIVYQENGRGLESQCANSVYKQVWIAYKLHTKSEWERKRETRVSLSHRGPLCPRCLGENVKKRGAVQHDVCVFADLRSDVLCLIFWRCHACVCLQNWGVLT